MQIENRYFYELEDSELEVGEIIEREIESSSLLLGYRFNKLQVV